MGIKSIDNNQKLYSNNEKNKLELGNVLFQKIPEG